MDLLFDEYMTSSSANALWRLKDHLVSAGWVVLESSDGTTYDNNGDILISGTSGAGGLNNNLAWFRIRSADGVVELCFQRISGASEWFRTKLARAPFDAGSPSATQVPATADPNDEQVISGSGTDAAPTATNGHLMGITGNCRLKVAADRDSAAFYIAGFFDGGVNISTALVLDLLTDTDEGDAFPYVAYAGLADPAQFAGAGGRGALSQAGPAAPNIYTFAPDGSGGGIHVPALAWFGTTLQPIVPAAMPVDPITGQHQVLAMPIARPASWGSVCWKGVASLMKWNAVSTALTGDTYSLDTARDRIVFDDVNLPWTGNVPVNGAPPTTDYDAVELWDFAQFYDSAPLGSASSTVYLMQAVDSVTSALVHWTATSPDFAGIGYPGPNSPTLIAIAAVK